MLFCGGIVEKEPGLTGCGERSRLLAVARVVFECCSAEIPERVVGLRLRLLGERLPTVLSGVDGSARVAALRLVVPGGSREGLWRVGGVMERFLASGFDGKRWML